MSINELWINKFLIFRDATRLSWLIIYEQPTAMRLLASPEGVAERSESFKIMIAGGNHSKIRKLDFLAIGSSEPIAKKDWQGAAIAKSLGFPHWMV